MLRNLSDQEIKSDKLSSVVRRLYFGFVLAGLLLTVATGLYQLGMGGMGMYFKQGWFHSKLTLVVILFVVTGMLAFEVRKFSAGKILSGGKVMALHGITSICFVVIIFLTLLNTV